ncbi:hypothetical protein [Tenacibaculum discolor]|uniref:hypothetical protein n=1 Tax=Tenacibaculum TaxID=104267 RepID=UPI0013DE9797|nr:hypothetical protein [Tenacibaculum discolor]
MKKSILNLGKALNKADQKQINGGDMTPIDCDEGCWIGGVCVSPGYFGCNP